MESRKYGFDESLVVVKPEDWIRLGGVGETIRPDGVWPLVEYEAQADLTETCRCTIYGMMSQIEMYIKAVWGFEPNYAERFTASLLGITCPGANPNDAYESARKVGLVEESDLPDATTIEELTLSQKDIDKYMSFARRWLTEYSLNHWWLPDTSKSAIIEQLEACPVGVAVTAWYEEDGVYVDRGLPNSHWCVAFAPADYKGRKTVKVFDTYDHSVKILHPDHRISFAKAITVTKAPIKSNWIIDLWTRILKALFNR